jgi:hypothetical protein
MRGANTGSLMILERYLVSTTAKRIYQWSSSTHSFRRFPFVDSLTSIIERLYPHILGFARCGLLSTDSGNGWIGLVTARVSLYAQVWQVDGVMRCVIRSIRSANPLTENLTP